MSNGPLDDSIFLELQEATGAEFTIMDGYVEGRLADDEGAEMLLKKSGRL